MSHAQGTISRVFLCCMSFLCFMIGSIHFSASVSILLSATNFTKRLRLFWFCSAHSVKRNKKAKQTNKNAHELTYWNNEARLWRTKKAWSGLSAQKWWRNAITFVTIAANSLLWRQPAWGKNKREYQVIHFTNASVLNAKKLSWGLRHQSEEH